ncbi:ATP-binding cassette domain-containing protein [Allorhizocola rhizosphaerae]|uniref:ATP-binding cassette domain-containing protein n=1 Tax=Allorhizocola rhizosphaerae TaxID=1872709 RepID=UPI000E3D929E|nr:ATP-binding cassette domain-containing protein [Allorhizocola rhizosphaerae]
MTVYERRWPRPAGASEITLQDVCFAYGEARVLNGVTLTLRPGEVIAVVGVNGAGKTTLAKLLTGQYQPDGGTMVTEPAAYAVYQDFNRYELSAYENIRIAAPAATRQQVGAAAAAVDATAMIERLTKGWETALSPKYADGSDLSGGQWQKIALARAALAAACGARLLVLDEPTANLDIEAELEAFDRNPRGARGGDRLADLPPVLHRAQGGPDRGALRRPDHRGRHARRTARRGRRIRACSPSRLGSSR